MTCTTTWFFYLLLPAWLFGIRDIHALYTSQYEYHLTKHMTCTVTWSFTYYASTWLIDKYIYICCMHPYMNIIWQNTRMQHNLIIYFLMTNMTVWPKRLMYSTCVSIEYHWTKHGSCTITWLFTFDGWHDCLTEEIDIHYMRTNMNIIEPNMGHAP
jgi:hypothetical protein